MYFRALKHSSYQNGQESCAESSDGVRGLLWCCHSIDEESCWYAWIECFSFNYLVIFLFLIFMAFGL